ncbi:MAG TPA: alanyl-tRNA editing protein [Rectinemataceae bacterium]|nr:alanyl-tRNA editing protein [Rectinemataceae bacterium]
MRETQRLFYEEPGLSGARARIIELGEGGRKLVLDRTVFYPEGGGQPCDLGTIGGIALVSVAEEAGRIVHVLSEPIAAAPGAEVELALDAARRLDHSVQHSAQHLISAVFTRLCGAATLSFHLGASRSTIDLDMPPPSDDELAEVELRLEEAVAEDYPYLVHLCPPERASDFPLRKAPPEGEEELRIVEIDGLDYSPCCGTHVSSSARLRMVKLTGVEKYKGITRLSFVAGPRAFADYCALSRAARDSARALGCSLLELPERVARAAERLKALEASLGRLERERAGLEADLAAAKDGGLPPFVSALYADRDADAAQEAVRALAARRAIALAASLPELTAVASAPSGAARLGERLRPMAEASGGRGGGGPSSFRAAFRDEPALRSFMRDASAELGG